MTQPLDSRAAEPAPIELRAVMEVLLRQRRIIAFSGLFVLAAAALFLALVTPRYTATALLLVDPAGGSLMEGPRATPVSTGAENARIDSAVEVLRSDALALRVIEDLGLAETEDFAPPPGLAARLARLAGRAHAGDGPDAATVNAQTIARFRDAVDVRRRGLTYLISISAESRDPAQARDLANALAESYIAGQVEGRIAASLAGRDILAGQIAAARARLAEYEERYDGFVEAQLAAIRAGTGGTEAALAEALARNRAAARDRSALVADLRASLATQDWDRLAGTAGDTAIRKLVIDRARLAEGADPAARLAEIDRLLEAEARGLTEKLAGEVAALDADAAELRAALRQAVPVERLGAAQLADLYEIRQEAAIARQQYQSLLERMRELETQAALQQADARVVSPAILPVRPSHPDKTLVMALALAGAAALGLGLAFVNEYVLGGITSPAQLTQLLDIPAAAEIPLMREDTTGRLSPADRIVDQPLSAYSESLRKLRAALDQSLRRVPAAGGVEGDGQLVLMTSALAGEGKTTTALALARSYALSGRKTLLIDADLRRPGVHELLGHCPARGFADYLRAPGDAEALRDFYARDPFSPLALILGAEPAQMATDPLLTGPEFAAILTQARSVYDITIIDSPPLLPAVDAVYIAAQVDAAVLAVKWGETGQTELRRALPPLAGALREGAALLGVLTHSRNRPGAAAGYAGYVEDYSAAT